MSTHRKTTSVADRWKNAREQAVRAEIQKKDSYEEIKNMRR